MRLAQIEAWTLSVLDRLVAGQPIEDDRVELKKEWPTELARAARRMAGHVNSGRGEPVLWIVGADEKAGIVPGVPPEDPASWWPQIERWFDEMAPDPVFLNVVFEGVTVVAILLGGERIPFVVKNPEGGAFERDVPWRVGTRTRSAKRSELVRILVPVTRLPLVEIMSASLTAHSPAESVGSRPTQYEGELRMEAYLEPANSEVLVLPQHRAKVAVVDGEGRELMAFAPKLAPGGVPVPSISTLRQQEGAQPPPITETISTGASQLIVQGPGLVYLKAYLRADAPWPLDPDAHYVLSVSLGIVAAPAPLRFDAPVAPHHTERHLGRWQLAKDDA